MSSEPTPLPPDRVTDCAPFEIVGIDLAGPLFLKNEGKVWIVIFTCAVYRAIHLELVNSLSSDAFLLALRRFIARRGRPRTIYCDNGTNFRGASNDLSKLNWSKILKETRTPKIFWKFIPPTAAWWEGWWERLVRTLKDLLKRTLGKSVLTSNELYTVICDCESIINCRPLTYVSENPEELIPLTPSMFLIENRSSNTGDIEQLNSSSLNKRIKYRSKLLKDLLQRFRKEYLGQLVQKHNEKHSRNPQVGEIVLVEIYSNQSVDKEPGGEESNSHDVCDNKNKLLPGADDVIMRKYTSPGRYVKAPKRLDLLNNVCYVLETLSESQGGGGGCCKVKREVTATRRRCCCVSLQADGCNRTTCDIGVAVCFMFISVFVSSIVNKRMCLKGF
ncbi:hypothetical protein AVEN_95705-1 [Araneus ventricosus]|uniref:Integrase catalytic domain-containing protein n=1 Tax=Araneus ventricosus TaxID=182803 RepID=A0A4Y2W858_ARAVE|nr:hypothetical protein AVEN_95705-1 [Araneus ventricosus]